MVSRYGSNRVNGVADHLVFLDEVGFNGPITFAGFSRASADALALLQARVKAQAAS